MTTLDTSIGSAILDAILGWPGVLIGLLAIVELAERGLRRRLLFPIRVKVIVGAIVFVSGVALAMHHQVAAGGAELERMRDIRAEQAQDAADRDSPEQRQRDADANQRLKSEANSLRQELATERNRQR